jgi:tetratricopeptide (TPR) repeat protein
MAVQVAHRTILAAMVVGALVSAGLAADESGPAEPVPTVPEEQLPEATRTNLQTADVDRSNIVALVLLEAQRSFRILEERLHSSMMELEQARRDSDVAAELRAAAFSNHLALLQEGLREQRQAELAWIDRSSRILLVVSGSFATVVLMLLAATVWFQVRSWRRLGSVPALSHPALAAPMALSAQPQPVLPVLLPAASESSQRLRSVVEQLEQRIRELEQISQTRSVAPVAVPASRPPNGGTAPVQPAVQPAPPDVSDRDEESHLDQMLGKGQSLLNAGEVEKALACFDQVIAREPRHAEALMKKGMVLERQEDYKGALEYYDRAISANRSLTLAYLHKGGVFNQLERFDEALECYEQALHLQQLSSRPG